MVWFPLVLSIVDGCSIAVVLTEVEERSKVLIFCAAWSMSVPLEVELESIEDVLLFCGGGAIG